MDDVQKLTDRELVKWMGILGPEKILVLHIDGKILLSNKQLRTYMGIESKKGRRGRS